MTTIDTRADTAVSDDGGAGVASFFATAYAWVVSTDHKRIGRLYAGFGLLTLMATAVLGLVLGLERADDGNALLDENALLQMFQAYRVGLVFAVVLPLSLGLAIAVTPLQLGARSIAFPRLALTGFYAWLGGLALTMSALGANGGIGGGDADMVDLFLAGHGLMILGLLASAGCVATSVLTTRAPGMTMRRVPLFAWSTLIGAIGMLLALPVAFGMIVYLFLDHRYAQLNFGGSEGIAAWVGYLFSVPMVTIFALPAIGVAAETLPVAFKERQALRGPTFAGIALVGVTALAAVTQQSVFDVTVDGSGQAFFEAVVPMLIFTGLPLLGLVMVLMFGALTAKNGLGNGRPHISAPFVFGFFGLGMIFVGVAGTFLMSITDLDLIGTSFEEGAVLYVVYGAVLGAMGGLVFWAPKLWGRVVPDKKVLPLALLGVTATVLAALPLYVAGFLGQAGGVPANDAQVAEILAISGVDGGSVWALLSLIGHGLMALTALAYAGLLIATFTGDGEQADANPYDAHTVEWGTSSPAPAHNFDHVPTVASAVPLLDTTNEGSGS